MSAQVSDAELGAAMTKIARAMGQKPADLDWYAHRIVAMANTIDAGTWVPVAPTRIRVEIITADVPLASCDGFVEHMLEMMLACPVGMRMTLTGEVER